MPFLVAIADLTHPLQNNRSSIGMIDCLFLFVFFLLSAFPVFFLDRVVPSLVSFGSLYLVTTAGFVANQIT